MEAVNWPLVKHMKIPILLMHWSRYIDFDKSFMDILAKVLLSIPYRKRYVVCLCVGWGKCAVNRKISIMFTMIKSRGNMYHQFVTWRWENNENSTILISNNIYLSNSLTFNGSLTFINFFSVRLGQNITQNSYQAVFSVMRQI